MLSPFCLGVLRRVRYFIIKHSTTGNAFFGADTFRFYSRKYIYSRNECSAIFPRSLNLLFVENASESFEYTLHLYSQGVQSQERHLFLFSDLLLIAKARSGGNFKLKQSVRMSELWLTAGHIEDVAETSKSQETSFVLGWPTTNVVATFM